MENVDSNYVTEQEFSCVFGLFIAHLAFLSLFKANSRRSLGAYFGWRIEAFGAPSPPLFGCHLPFRIPCGRPLPPIRPAGAPLQPPGRTSGAFTNHPGALSKRPQQKSLLGLASPRTAGSAGPIFTPLFLALSMDEWK